MNGPAERRTVVVMFAGLDDFASWADRAGPEEARVALDALFTGFRSLTERMGGHVDKFVGECAMVVFGAPVSHGDDAVRAVRCALGLRTVVREFNVQRGTGFRLRSGLNAGEVLWGSVGGDRATATGDVVNVARRLYEAADPGTIVVGEGVERQVTRVVSCRALPALQARNREEPVAAWEVEGEDAGGSVSRIMPLRPLVGRDAEVQALLAPLAAGRSSFVVVEGEAGLGKSRLLTEVRMQARRRLGHTWVAWGRAPDDVRLPLAAFGDIVGSETGIRVTSVQDAERLAEGLARQMSAGSPTERENTAQLIVLSLGHELPGARVAAIDPARFESEAHAAWERWLSERARGAPALLCIEDLHQADEGTRLLLARLAGAWSERPSAILCSARPGSPPPAGFAVVSLRGLAGGSAAEIASSVLGGQVSPGLAGFIEEKSGGNPYLVEELAGFLRDNALVVGSPMELRGPPPRLPSNLTGFLVARLDREPAETREAIKAASAVGRSFWPGVVSVLAGRPVLPDIDRARRDGLVDPEPRSLLPDDPQLTFRHALLRDAAYSLLPRRERARLHALAAAELERRSASAGRAVLALAGGHREAAGEPGAAAVLWLRAAEAALAQNSSREAADWAARARAARDTCRAAVLHASALRRLGDPEGAIRACREAVALAGDAGSEGSGAWADLAGYLQVVGSTTDVDRAARRAIELATDPPSWVRAANALVPALVAEGKLDEAARLADRLVQTAEAPGFSTPLITRARESRAYTHFANRRFDQAIEDWELAAANWKAAGDLFSYANSLNNIGIVENTLLRPEAALARHREAERIRREIGDRLGLATSITNTANVHFRMEQWDEALALSLQALDIRRKCGDTLGCGLTLGNMALIFKTQGRIAEAVSAITESARMRAGSGNVIERSELLVNQARILLLHGDPAGARALVEEARRILQVLDRVDLQRQCLWVLLALEEDDGNLTKAVELLRTLLPLCRPDEPGNNDDRTARAYLFQHLHTLGRHAEAGAVMAELEAMAGSSPELLPLIHSLRVIQHRAEDPAAAIRHCAEAVRLVRDSGSADEEFDFLSDMVDLQCTAGDTEGARATGQRLEDVARTIDMSEFRPVALLRARLRILVARGLREEALQTAGESLRDLDARGAVRSGRIIRRLLGDLGLPDPTA